MVKGEASSTRSLPASMHIMQVAGECLPYSKTGGLADMVGALAKSLAGQGHRITVVTPLYKACQLDLAETTLMDWDLEIWMGGELIKGRVRHLEVHSHLHVLFIEHPEFFGREGLYGEGGADYPDNAHRYTFFCKACANLARYWPEPPQLIHVHDWQAALVPTFVDHQHLYEGWASPPKTILTIHNLAYQGNFPGKTFELCHLPESYFRPETGEFFGQMSFLKSGMVHADALTTVSPTYAREILTQDSACGMEGILNHRKQDLHGILNGVDYDDWQTENNPFLDHAYGPQQLDGKAQQKALLQAKLDLVVSDKIPLFGLVSRLVDQKGMDILLPALNATLDRGFQVALLGTGMPHYQEALERLASRFPKQVAVTIGYSNALAHQIEAGSDFFLMPSRFEPCGLNQMYSLRYGSVPIVRNIGGLRDSVTGLQEDPRQADGIKFQAFSVSALIAAVEEALKLFEDPPRLKGVRQRGMQKDFSWDLTSGAYLDLYRSLLKKKA